MQMLKAMTPEFVLVRSTAMEWAKAMRFVPPARDGKVEPAVVTVEVPWR